ncbi:small GTP-binding protein domain [Edhazardia aedis USNM 41457]|uniref:Small GTP-binding protein domain n=1 Tax=Edhazardia aedis (strain USNM 41457) TaxID=1003232 RepID=J9DKC5_EDHAE|nr:small GTP-binding protein domain [Edhazardia aedis USNM 41457]|eukprot:EJW01832.1 small GTP-binding protein domain [Edhazardia aedis USNM 41457]
MENDFSNASGVNKQQAEIDEIRRIENLPDLCQAQLQPHDYRAKIVIIGDGGVGKTSFVKRFIGDGDFSRAYKATIGVETNFLYFQTTTGHTILFEVWDTAGQEINSGLSDIYYIGADGFIVFFDVTSRITHKSVKTWICKAEGANQGKQNLPIVVVGNKVDLMRERKVKADNVRKSIPRAADYTDMSVAINYNVEKAFLIMARRVFNAPNLQFVANTYIQPSEIKTAKQDAEMLAALEKAQKADILDEEPREE